MHILRFEHAHQRYDRDNYVQFIPLGERENDETDLKIEGRIVFGIKMIITYHQGNHKVGKMELVFMQCMYVLWPILFFQPKLFRLCFSGKINFEWILSERISNLKNFLLGSHSAVCSHPTQQPLWF